MPRSGVPRSGARGSFGEMMEEGSMKTVVPRSRADESMDGGDVTQEHVHVHEPPTTVIGKFSHGLANLWSTRQTITSSDSDIKIKTTLRELIIYLIFLTLLTILSFGMMSSTMFYFTNSMETVFLNTEQQPSGLSYTEMAFFQDFWTVMQGVILPGLYPNQWYNGLNYSTADLGFILHENRILGVPRLRQVRVRNDSCTIPSDFKTSILECFDTYTESLEDQSPFGLANGTAWTYQSSSALQGSSYSGLIATYGGGGYHADLMHTIDDSSTIVSDLMNNLWIDRGTRAVFLDFTVYNANINLFCVIKLLVEMPASGGIVASYSFNTVKLLRYITPGDFFVMACEIMFMILVIYYIIEEAIEIKKNKCAYFKSFSNILDIVILIMACCCAIFSIYLQSSINKMLESLLINPDQFADFSFLSYWQGTFNAATALMLFMSWIKIFKYISFNRTMTQLSSTLGRCSKDLVGFAVMFFIIFFAFAQMGYLLFGSQLEAYSSFASSIFSLFRLILGDFDFPALQQASHILGPAYFICYVFFVFFILLNMFLAIINDTYSEVKSDIAEQQSELEMGDFLKKGAFKMMERLNIKKEKVMDLEEAMHQKGTDNADGIRDFEEWRTNMKRRGYAEAEIEAVFAKYDVDGDLNKEKRVLDGDMGAVGGSADVSLLQMKVDRLEQSVCDCVSKVDNVLSKLEAIERTRARRQNTMSKILDNLTEGASREQLANLMHEEMQEGDSLSDHSSRPRSAYDRD